MFLAFLASSGIDSLMLVEDQMRSSSVAVLGRNTEARAEERSLLLHAGAPGPCACVNGAGDERMVFSKT